MWTALDYDLLSMIPSPAFVVLRYCDEKGLKRKSLGISIRRGRSSPFATARRILGPQRDPETLGSHTGRTMKKRLTDRFLQTVKPPAAGRDVYSDTDALGLELRVSERGMRSWSIRYRSKGGERRRTTYGTYPAIPLAEARARAREIAAAAARGLDLPKQEERQREEQSRAEERPQNLGALIDRYIEQHCRPMQRRSGMVERLFARHVPPRMAAMPLDELRRANLVELLDDLQNKKGLKAQVNQVRAHLIAALNWAADREYLEVNPFAGVKKRRLEAPRTRVLADRELRAIWRAAETRSATESGFVKALFLTGQRRDEVRCMNWSEVDIDGAVWTLLAARNKSKRDQDIPLVPTMVEVLGTPRRTGPCSAPMAAGRLTSARSH